MGTGSTRMGSSGDWVNEDGNTRVQGQQRWDRAGTGSMRWDQVGSGSTRMESGGVWVSDGIGRELKGDGLGKELSQRGWDRVGTGSKRMGTREYRISKDGIGQELGQ